MGTKPHHKVSDDFKLQITALKSFGITNEEIAKYLGISHDTLTKFYQHELITSRVTANVEMAKSLYKKGIDGDVTAMIFWLKTQARWRTEDSKVLADSNDDLNREMKALRAKLDAQNRRDY